MNRTRQHRRVAACHGLAMEPLAPYSTTSRYSHYEQGLGSGTIITTATGGTGVVQYYATRENDTNLYLSSYVPNGSAVGSRSRVPRAGAPPSAAGSAAGTTTRRWSATRAPHWPR